jgi:hypothetical protein
MLCTIEQWKRYDGNFDHDAFYKNIVQMFELVLFRPGLA